MRNYEKSIADVEQAYETLRNVGLQFEERNAAELFSLPDLVELFRNCGAKVEIEEPTLDDFNDANRRACLHLPPHPPDTKSDEMRDLVIWATALRLAARDGGAILLSRDELHNHVRGTDEATEVKLVRMSNVDDLLELLGVESPAGKLARSLLEPIWNDLRTAELPLLPELNLRKVDSAVFRSGEAGIEEADFDFATNTENSGTLETHIEIAITGDKITEARLREITLDGEPWREGTLTISPNKPVSAQLSRVDERLDALREVIGE